MTYYAQFNTDIVIETYFPNHTTGVCVEVGAYDGIKGSNTKHFEEIGWETVCIEPNNWAFDKLKRNRSCRCFNNACGSRMHMDTLEIFNFKSGIQSSLTSLKPDERLVRDYADAIDSRSQQQVQTRTLTSILDECGLNHMDFVSIDTEGTELDVLKGLDLDKFDITLLVVENNYNDVDISEYLEKYGYVKHTRYKVNDFFIRE